MSVTAPESDDPPLPVGDPWRDRDPAGEQERPASEAGWLGAIVDQLESDPTECWLAMEALATVEPAARQAIIAELSCHEPKSGVRTLLRLLSGSRDPITREAAGSALRRAGRAASKPPEPTAPAPGDSSGKPRGGHSRSQEIRTIGGGSPPGVPDRSRSGSRTARCLVTPVDGQGRGSIVVSVSQAGQRRTAAFWCDLRQGIRDVVGEVEPESVQAGRLVDEMRDQTPGDCACDVAELALGLLAGCLMLCGPSVPSRVRDWLDGTLGPGFQPSGFPVSIPGLEPSSVPDEEMPQRARAVLEACPSWLDRSPLTYEMAEEISLREGRLAVDPDRDAGAFRFLFEHRLIHHLELYRRMLLWMAWLWNGSGQAELSRSALALAGQLSDEQYAVPSHPFTVAISTRSLEAARARLRTPEDPRVR